MKTILSLFDYSGNWAKPYAANAYQVILVDSRHVWGLDETDFLRPVVKLRYDLGRGAAELRSRLPPIHGILAAPPCTHFSASGAQYWREKDVTGQTESAVQLVRTVLDLVAELTPKWWALENPVGRMNEVVPELARFGPRYFQPFWYGHPYTKKTGLWGEFVMPEPTNMVKPRKDVMISGFGGGDGLDRSETPIGFALAFFRANP